VLDAAVRSSNARSPYAVLVTGDLLDNAQANELALARTVLDGGRAEARLGRARLRRGAGRRRSDPAYYRPDVRSRRAIRACWPPPSGVSPHPDCALPWYASRATTTCWWRASWPAPRRRRRSPSGGRTASSSRRRPRCAAQRDALTPQLVDRALSGGLPGRTTRIAPDPGRRELTPAEAIAACGRQRARRRGARMDYAFDVGRACA
jgi:hypothetical protein